MTDLPDTLNPTLAARAVMQDAGVATGRVEGEWDDVEWRAVAARGARTPAEAAFVANGPRVHPFGVNAVMVREDDQPVRFFPSEDARKAWEAAKPTAPVPAVAAHSPPGAFVVPPPLA